MVFVKPILFSIFGFNMASWYVFFCLSLFVAYFLAFLLLRQAGNKKALYQLPSIFSVAYLCGYFGARTLSIIVEGTDNFFADLFFSGSLTFYGGIIAGAVAVIMFVFFAKLPMRLFVDVGAIAVWGALSLGRIGCFLNGCDYGLPIPSQQNNSWWTYVNPILNDNVMRFPTQLEESVMAFFVALVGFFTFFKIYRLGSNKYQGYLGSILFAWLGLHRFLNEMFRGDERGYFLHTHLSTSQGISLIVVALSVAYFLYISVTLNQCTAHAKQGSKE